MKYIILPIIAITLLGFAIIGIESMSIGNMNRDAVLMSAINNN